MPDRLLVKVDGHELELSNLDKVLYPAAGFTKGEVIDYYTRIAPVLLPHLEARPLTRIRFPNGVEWAYSACPLTAWEEFTRPGQSRGEYIARVLDAKPNARWDG